MNTQASSMVGQMVFRKTNQHVGRRISVTPANSTNRHLSYGRIILNSSLPSVTFTNGGQETGLVCLSGGARIKVDSETFELGQYDSAYLPRDRQIEVHAASEVDLAEFSSDVEHRYPLQVIPYADLQKDPALKFTTGKPGQQRQPGISVRRPPE